MDQNNKKAFVPPVMTAVTDIPEIDSASASDGWGMGDMLFDLNRWSFGESDFE